MNTAAKFKSIQKTQPVNQAAAKNQFHTVLADFFESNDAQGHIRTLTKLCRAFTGVTFEDSVSRMDIANMVFAADEIRQFIRDIADLYYSPDYGGMSDDEKSLIGDMIRGEESDDLIEVISSGLQDWIYPTDPDHTIERLNLSLNHFKTISDLIKVCSKIHLTVENRLEGGTTC